MSLDLSILLVLRDIEPMVARMVRSASLLAGPLVGPAHEIVALDEHSGDNTLSVLSLLHGAIPELRTLQNVAPGAAIQQAARVARGAVWLIIDHPADPELMRWALREVREHGKVAAIVPGEVMAIDAPTGATLLADLKGGLVSAQNVVERALRRQGTLATRPAPGRGLAGRALLFVRGRLGRLGLAGLDRPLGG